MADILVVDNNQHISRMFDEILSRDGHKVTIANNGFGALELIDKNDFEIAFIDIGLPDINGLELLKLLHLKSPLTITTVISGKNDINAAIESIKTGVFRYLKKPFDLDEIAEIANLAHRERMNMIRAQYLPGRLLDSRDRGGLKLHKLLIDLPLILIALQGGFFLHKEINRWLGTPSFWSLNEIIYLSLSLACCYGFMFFQNPQSDNKLNKHRHFNHDFKNLSLTYVIFTAILFFVTNFVDSRIVLIGGYCFGLAGLLLSNYSILPYLDTILAGNREGSKSIILKGFNESIINNTSAYDAEKARVHELLAKESETKRPNEPSADDETEYLYDDATRVSENQASGLIARFKDSRLRFNPTRQKDKAEHISR
jgi:CheY-like chemotaxis protein